MIDHLFHCPAAEAAEERNLGRRTALGGTTPCPRSHW
jgi:hypothetical protein